MAKAKNNVIKEAEVEISYFTASEEAQYLADMRDLWESDVNSRLYDATEEGLKRGMEKRWKEKTNRNSKKNARKGKRYRRNNRINRINKRRNRKFEMKCCIFWIYMIKYPSNKKKATGRNYKWK